jgi:hypothetical protein
VGCGFPNHHEGARAVFLNVTGKKKHLTKPVVPRDRAVRMAEALRCERVSTFGILAQSNGISSFWWAMLRLAKAT